MIKSILVPSTDDAVVACEAGLDVAHLFGAHVECLRIHPDPVERAVRAANADAGTGIMAANLWKALEDEDRAQTVAAKAAFDTLCERQRLVRADLPTAAAGVTVSWRERTGDEYDELNDCGRLSDLIVVDGRQTSGRAPSALGALLVGCGRPVLLAAGERISAPKTVVVAWKNTRESAHALTAAMPFLKLAERVVVLTVSENNRATRNAVESVEGVATSLRWHGMKVEGQCIAPGDRGVTAALLGTARDLKADLLVTGAYGHSRIRELVFGGFTADLLKGVPLPVLAVH